jgi:hypothetical protein
VGTPRYMAPEQRAAGTIEARDDQYSFCVSLREVLPPGPPARRRAARRCQAATAYPMHEPRPCEGGHLSAGCRTWRERPRNAGRNGWPTGERAGRPLGRKPSAYSTEFCSGREFTAGGLRHWAYRLRQVKAEGRKAAAVPVVRLARVERAPAVSRSATRAAAQGSACDGVLSGYRRHRRPRPARLQRHAKEAGLPR